MRKQGDWYPQYCDDTCILITLKGTWTKTKAGGTFCQRHGTMVSTCAVCGKQFHSLRVHTKTCGDAHRKALSRLQLESVTKGNEV